MGYKFNPFTGSFDIDSEGSDWKLTGNSGTTAGTNFVGTTDAVDLVFKRNSTEVMRITDGSKVGIQIDAPLSPLHVVGAVGSTINSVTTASVTTANESLSTSPTGSITLVAEFPALSSTSTNQNTGTGSYTANGQTIDYNIYQAIYNPLNGQYYVSSFFQTASFTDSINDGTTNFEVVVSVSGQSANADYFFVEKQINFGGFTDSTIFSAGSSFTDTGWTGTSSVNSWPTQYVLSYTTPTAPSGATGQEINIGAGNLTESGVTYDFEIRSCANVGGTYYSEQTGTAGTFTDANMAQTFDLQIDYTAGSGDDQIVRVSTDGGSTWAYNFTGSGAATSFVWTNQGNDSVAETAWSNNIASVQLQYAFKAYAKNTPPGGGATVYTPSSNTYYATITVPNTFYVFKHTYTGFPAGGAKVLGDYNAGVSNGLDITGDFVDIGFNTWASGTTISPTTYAFANGTARYFKLVGYNGTIYSTTPLIINATTSGSQYFTGSFTFPSGVTAVKILLSTDGGSTYTVSKSFSSPTATFVLDSIGSGWTGNNTITPTASVPTAVRIDRNQTSATDVPHLSLIENSGSGTRLSSLAFGIAASSSVTPTYQSNIIGYSNTGYIGLGTARLVGYTSTAQTTESWTLGSAVQFNLQKSSSIHPTIYASHASDPLAYFYSASNSTRGTLYLGTTSLTSSVTDALLCVAPQAGGGAGLVFRRTSGFTGDNIRIDEAGSYKAGWGQAGRMYLNATAVSTTTYLRIGGTGSGSQIRLESGSIGTVEGDISHGSTQKCLTAYVNGIQQYDSRALFVQTATGTCANTTTETTITSTGIGTLTLPANFFVAGKTIRIKAWGFHSSTASPNLTMKVKFGSTAILTTGAHAMHNDTNGLWEIDCMITCRTTGSSGTVFGQGLFADYGTLGDHVQMVNTATTTVNTTTTQAVTVSAQWGTASASNTISLTNLAMEVLF